MINRINMERQGFGSQRYFCAKCQQTFTDTFDTLYYRRQVSEKDVRIVLQAHTEGSSLRGISRISGLAYDTVVRHVQAAAQKAQMVHNAQVQDVDTDAVVADELWSNAWKKTKTLLTTRARDGGLLDRIEFSSVEWINSDWSCWQTYR